MQNTPSAAGWRFDKHISVGHIATTVIVVVSALWWAAKMEGRVAVLEATDREMAVRVDRDLTRLDGAIERSLIRIERRLDTIDGKLDGKQDRPR